MPLVTLSKRTIIARTLKPINRDHLPDRYANVEQLCPVFPKKFKHRSVDHIGRSVRVNTRSKKEFCTVYIANTSKHRLIHQHQANSRALCGCALDETVTLNMCIRVRWVWAKPLQHLFYA